MLLYNIQSSLTGKFVAVYESLGSMPIDPPPPPVSRVRYSVLQRTRLEHILMRTTVQSYVNVCTVMPHTHIGQFPISWLIIVGWGGGEGRGEVMITGCVSYTPKAVQKEDKGYVTKKIQNCLTSYHLL